MSLTNTYPQGELSPFFVVAFLSALRPVLCLKTCFRKTCLHRGNSRVFFVFSFLVVLASPLFRDILGWILVILGVFLGWGVPRRLGGVDDQAEKEKLIIKYGYLAFMLDQEREA